MGRLSDVRGCHFWNEDLSLTKSFPVTERFGVQLGVDAFNAFNRVNFLGFVGDIDNPAFGQTTGASGGRFIQLHLKIAIPSSQPVEKPFQWLAIPGTPQ